MKILYFGTVCDISYYNQLLQNSQAKPSIASIVFETALIDGFYKNGVDIEIHSFPMVPTFPKMSLFHFGGHDELLPSGYKAHWLNTINIPILKQWSRRIDAKNVIRAWIKKNGTEGVIMTYSIPPFLVKDIIALGKKYSVKTVAIVPDLPRNMFINHMNTSVKSWLQNIYLRPTLEHQGKYDGYIYLTEFMRDIISPHKPYIVMEGIADLNEVECRDITKTDIKAVMYAGRLHEKYGVMNLIDAFDQIKDVDAELWLFGDGTAVADIQKRAENNPRIKYFGRVTRDEILRHEREATLLVNPRSSRDEFTKYSFPSKTIEYMYSGTPLLTTKLSGIPEEYYEHLFTVEDNDVSLLSSAIRSILLQSGDTLDKKGRGARRFIKEHKNSVVQSGRIIDFLSDILGG